MPKGKKPVKRKTESIKAEKARQMFAELPPSLDIKKIGRPSKYDPSFCDLVLDLGSQGKSKAQMAAAIGVSRTTMDAWATERPEFMDALKSAGDLALSWWENAGQINMTRQGFNATAYIFQMKNRFKEDYRDSHVNEHTGSVVHQHLDVKRMSDDELRQMVRDAAEAIVGTNGDARH